MKLSIKFADDVNRSDVGKRRNNRRLMACPDGACSPELVRLVQATKGIAPAKNEKTALKIIEARKEIKSPHENVANRNLAKMSNGNDHMPDVMRGAIIEAGDRGEIEIIEADDDAFSFVPLQETLRRFLMTDDPDDETWTINISRAAFSPILASTTVHDAPQEVH